ncbi:MAG: bifunctional hydroxymethylpyrimidine kinase/phosphomethylpyrimidine kinase, partial [Alicyclobacillus shizuokensis]|nr:bifunctional hydroxymethylpyrimidine kinase/phosphomethylpyrimidine kinase [Alicyclobacillus shizuokensis]
GLAFITVASSGENNIILSAGANGRLTAADVEAAAPGLRDVDAVLLQNEIPWSVTQSALQWAHQFGKRVFLNPAPARRVGRETLSMVDVLVLNETEAQVITGIQVDTPHRAETACQRLLGEGCQGVVLTLGSNGLVYQDKAGRSLRVPAFSVEVVDTTAAGDTFIGALAAIWEADADLPRALRFASAAAALTVTRAGAQESIPERGEIESFLSQVSDAEHTHLPG